MTHTQLQLSLPFAASAPPVIEAFLSSPWRPTPSHGPVIHVHQSEAALIELPPSQPLVLLSTEATSCLILVAVNPSSRRAVAAHLDSPRFSISELFDGFDPSSPTLLFLLGACPSAKSEGQRVLDHLSQSLSDWGGAFSIAFAAIGPALVHPESHRPRARELAVLISASLACHAVQPDVDSLAGLHPPCVQRRARFWVSDDIAARGGSGWTLGASSLTVVKFAAVEEDSGRRFILRHRPWTARLSPRALAYYAYILSLDDRAILERCSTTPQDEAPDFAEGIRSTFSFLLSKSNAEGPMDDEEGIELAGSRVIDVPETVWGWRDGKWAAEEVD